MWARCRLRVASSEAHAAGTWHASRSGVAQELAQIIEDSVLARKFECGVSIHILYRCVSCYSSWFCCCSPGDQLELLRPWCVNLTCCDFSGLCGGTGPLACHDVMAAQAQAGNAYFLRLAGPQSRSHFDAFSISPFRRRFFVLGHDVHMSF
jgi:hypothetical protein